MLTKTNIATERKQVSSQTKSAPLIAHIVFKLDVGGLENGLVNLINHIPEDRYRHVIICLTDYSDFRFRIRRSDIQFFALHNPAGKNVWVYFKLWRLLRQLKPDVVHTRNLAALECMVSAALAGVRARVHSEHGRDVFDLDGSNRKYQLWRRLFKPFVHRYIALSQDLEDYLKNKVLVRPDKVVQIYNGVDAELFHPTHGEREPLPFLPFASPDLFIIGTVGRLQAVKDQINLVRAFISLVQTKPEARQFLRLVIIGDGPLYQPAIDLLKHANVQDLAWLPGPRSDVSNIMRGLDLFVLPSLGEGISNTILEAMACGLPIVATRVGGNPELIEEGKTGKLVPSADSEALAQAIYEYFSNRDLAKRHGAAARIAVERRFSLNAMVTAYLKVYDEICKKDLIRQNHVERAV